EPSRTPRSPARGVPPMERLSSFVLTHRRWIFAFWLVMFIAGIAAAGAVPNRLSYDFSLPGQQGYETEKKIIESYDGANAQVAYNAQLKEHGFTGGLTGYAQLASGGGDNSGPSVLEETMLGALGALAVLVFVFASLLALVPLLIAAVSILTTFLIVLLLTVFT